MNPDGVHDPGQTQHGESCFEEGHLPGCPGAAGGDHADRCGAWLPRVEEPCWRHPGHRWEHRSRYALENANRMATGAGLR